MAKSGRATKTIEPGRDVNTSSQYFKSTCFDRTACNQKSPTFRDYAMFNDNISDTLIGHRLSTSPVSPLGPSVRWGVFLPCYAL